MHRKFLRTATALAASSLAALILVTQPAHAMEQLDEKWTFYVQTTRKVDNVTAVLNGEWSKGAALKNTQNYVIPIRKFPLGEQEEYKAVQFLKPTRVRLMIENKEKWDTNSQAMYKEATFEFLLNRGEGVVGFTTKSGNETSLKSGVQKYLVNDSYEWRLTLDDPDVLVSVVEGWVEN